VVTHYRLKNDPDGNGVIVDPEAKLEEELIVRPTSETIIWSTYKNWIKSYRDLPLLINQWANVVRWEMRTRLFLRTTEFFWQEGHTAHETATEAVDEAKLMLNEYADFMNRYMAVPVIRGVKSANERFAGAEDTYTVEGMMQDGKALQMGTSHFLGQNFAKAFEVKFQNRENKEEYVWATSWGVSTRMMGALVMSHSDDEGLVLPPMLAPIQVVIIPIFKGAEQLEEIKNHLKPLIEALKAKNVLVKLDEKDHLSPGFKFAEYELLGVPIRLAIGKRDIENGTIEVARRDLRTKESIAFADAEHHTIDLLARIQDNLLKMAEERTQAHTTPVANWEEFIDVIENKGGFAEALWDGTSATEEKIKELTKATIRCIPLENLNEAVSGVCVYSGAPAVHKVLFARAY
jgi:prolyl-tRNA synthetase